MIMMRIVPLKINTNNIDFVVDIIKSMLIIREIISRTLIHKIRYIYQNNNHIFWTSKINFNL